MNYGEVIQQLRKKANMTQAELGEKMNVSGQAVSKWENGLSQPDFETVRKCCELFHITMDDFSKMMKGEEIAPAAAPARAQDGASFLGVCTKCGKAIGPDDLGESSPHLLCKDCVAARKKKIAGEVKFQREKHRRRVVASFIVAPIVAAVFILFGIVGGEWWVGLWLAFFGFTFAAQLFWEGFVPDFVLGSLHIFGGPGVIFEFSLDGFIFLIAAKIIIFAGRLLLTLVIFLGGCLIAFLLSPFTFIPAAVRYLPFRESEVNAVVGAGQKEN